MRVKVLGSAAGGGAPQWNCGCPNCVRLRGSASKARTQTQLALSPSEGVWFLAGASPDLRQQLTRDPDFAPRSSRGTPIEAVILSSADVDSVLGLLHLREFQHFRIYATAGVQRALTEENSLFRTLARSQPPVEWHDLPLEREIEISQSGAAAKLTCKAVSVNGKFPDYMSDALRSALPPKEAVVALEFAQSGKRLLFAPSFPWLSPELKIQIAQADVAFLDGTFWTDDELLHFRGSGPSAREMGHLPLSGPGGLVDQLKDLTKARRILIHLNNTNPVLDESSGPAHALRDPGYDVAYDGMEVAL